MRKKLESELLVVAGVALTVGEAGLHMLPDGPARFWAQLLLPVLAALVARWKRSPSGPRV